MTRRTRSLGNAAASALLAAGTALSAASAAHADPAYTVTPVHFDVQVGPGSATTCHLVADLYRPAGADADHPVPVVIGTHGCGMSKDQYAEMMRLLASEGYGAWRTPGSVSAGRPAGSRWTPPSGTAPPRAP